MSAPVDVLNLAAHSEAEQERLGALLAQALVPGLVVCLQGDLGAGKTTLVRGCLRALGHQGAVKSPTYTLVEPYEIDGKRFFHFDLYRLADPEELEYLGIRDLLGGDAVLLVEWPEQGVGMLPPADLWVRIAHRPDGRELEIRGETAAGVQALERLRGLTAEVRQ